MNITTCYTMISPESMPSSLVDRLPSERHEETSLPLTKTVLFSTSSPVVSRAPSVEFKDDLILPMEIDRAMLRRRRSTITFLMGKIGRRLGRRKDLYNRL